LRFALHWLKKMWSGISLDQLIYHKTSLVISSVLHLLFYASHLSLSLSLSLVCLFTGRTPKRRQPVFKFTHRSIISIFAPIHVKFGTANGHIGPLGRAKSHADGSPGVGTRPPK